MLTRFWWQFSTEPVGHAEEPGPVTVHLVESRELVHLEILSAKELVLSSMHSLDVG